MPRRSILKVVKVSYTPSAPWMVRVPTRLQSTEGSQKKFFEKESVAKAYAERLARQMGEYQTQARQFIPLAAVEGDFAASANRAPEFELKYPHDPLTPLFVAVHDLKLQRVGEAETVLRAAMEAHTPLRPEAEPQIQGLARAFLAVVLKAERRSWEARDAAAPLCKPGAPAKPHEMVAKAKLCDPG